MANLTDQGEDRLGSSSSRWWFFLRGLLRTGVVYGFAGWVYIVVNSEVHPSTLGSQLTHFFAWPHEDTFGEACFAISAICFALLHALPKRPITFGPQKGLFDQ